MWDTELQETEELLLKKKKPKENYQWKNPEDCELAVSLLEVHIPCGWLFDVHPLPVQMPSSERILSSTHYLEGQPLPSSLPPCPRPLWEISRVH
jgi:hypothetical protein